MNKYLLFRTDRIGDFLLSLILIKSIKRNDSNSHITLVSSEKNYEYIKSFKIVDDVILLKKSFFNKINTFLLLNKNSYKSIIIHDSKIRSKIISYFLKSETKYYLKKKYLNSYIDEIKIILNNLNFNFSNEDLNTLSSRNLNNSNINGKDYILFHFDEKWIFDQYINSYVNIEPSEKDLEVFLNNLAFKSNKKIIVTSGKNIPMILKNVFDKKLNQNIKLIKSSSFIELEKVIANSSLLISCHGAVSHIAAAKNINQIDIIDQSYNYQKWTKHFRNYKSILRQDFKDLSTEITYNL